MTAGTSAGQGTAAPATDTYRLDLDGLRGFAIALVVLFHVFVGRVSGGVDVFLLLSGYFFLGSQLRYASRPGASLNPWWPLWRVIRRLVPALAVALAATVLAVLLVTRQLITPELTRQVTASIGYFLNWELINQDAAYAAASVNTSPLQHLWSMSVQGQFYVFAITLGLVLAWLARSRGLDAEGVRRIAGPILIVITAASFLWACRHGLVGTPGNYYSTFSRAWELTLGGVLALYQGRLRLPRWSALLGMAMIAVTGIIVSETFVFPGPVALLPVSGAVLVILSGGRNAASRALTSPFSLWLGNIAYSLYLWHWPLLIVLTALIGREEPPFVLGVAVIAASLILADLTYRHVESPLRQHRRRPTTADDPVRDAHASLTDIPGRARALGGVGVATLAAGLLTVQPGYAALAGNAANETFDPARYPGVMAQFGAEYPDEPARPEPAVAAGIFPAPGDQGCLVFIPEPTDLYPAELGGDANCIYGDTEAELTVVVAGGSHAEPWTEPLDVLGKQHGFRVVPFLRQECPIVLGAHYGVSPECADWAEGAVERIVALDPDVVVSTSSRPVELAGVGPDIVPLGYEAFWAELDRNEIEFLGLRDNPWTLNDDLEPADANYCLLDLGPDSVDDCATRREYVYADVDPAEEVMGGYEFATAVDTSDWFCGPVLCPPVIGNITVYRDQNHISNAFAVSTAPLLWERLEPLLAHHPARPAIR